jgi:hypothetical protein
MTLREKILIDRILRVGKRRKARAKKRGKYFSYSGLK